MKLHSLPPWRHQQQIRPAGHPYEWFFWTLFGLATLIYLAAAGNDNSFHDFLGGRFPVADGFDWLKASLDAASGYRTDYGVKRPWNLPFNVVSLWIGHRIGPDPLVSALAIKRIVALASIATALAALRPRLTLVTTAGLGTLLVSTLPRLGLSPLQDFIGQGLGYTQGSELNAFIFANVAIAWFVLGVDSLEAGRFPEHALRSAAGFLLLTIAVQARPGTLGLLPALAVLVAVAAGRLGSDGRQPRWAWRRIVPVVLLAVMGWLLVSGRQLAMERKLARTACGTIGGNSGVSIMGMATGQTWREALQETNETKLPGCGNDLSRRQRNIGIERIRRNPLPFLNLLKRNAISLFSLPSMFLILVTLGATALASARPIGLFRLHGETIGSGDFQIFNLAICGSLSVIAFQILFFREAGLRPSIPYCLFPFLLLAFVVDRSLWSLSPSASPASSQSRSYDFIAPLMTLFLAACLALGMLLMQRQALRSSGYAQVTGSIQVSPEWLDNWMAYKAISSTIGIMHQFQTSPDLASKHPSDHPGNTPLCVHYQRRGLPWGLPYGKLNVTHGRC